jgi:hypothetical protein
VNADSKAAKYFMGVFIGCVLNWVREAQTVARTALANKQKRRKTYDSSPPQKRSMINEKFE